MEVDEEEVAIRPRTLDTSEYVRARVHQIAELLEVVDNSALGTGEVTSGPRTVFQRLPRHMRRRAMSHNIKRLPRLLRPVAMRNISRTQHKKKPPSRLWRRRPSRLLKRKLREQKKPIWLTTHIWHAKRFFIKSLWGYKLPWRCCQRGFRPSYRSAVNSAVIIDQSYLCCLQFIVSDNAKSSTTTHIIDTLSQFCRKNVSSTFANFNALSGNIEMPTMLFTPTGHRQFIGPARFSWCERRLNLWIHPSMESEFLNEILRMENVQIVPNRMESKNGGKGAGNLQEKSPSAASKPIQMFNLRGHFCRFQLIGPNSLAHLHYALKLVSEKELESHDEFRQIHKWWNENAPNILPGNLKSGTQMPLLVEDPRLFRAERRPNILPSRRPATDFADPPPTSSQLFWDSRRFRRESLPKRLSREQFEKFNSGRILYPEKTDFKIPILLIFRSATTPNSSTGTSSSSANRVDFLCPSSVGHDFWLSLQFANNRAIGLHEKTSLDLESGLLAFPDDCPDSLAGRKQIYAQAKELMAKHQRKPNNRRINFLQHLDGTSPFNFDWHKLGNVNRAEDVFVLRDRASLRRLEISMNSTATLEEDDFGEECLVPVSLELLSKGVPKRFALIYLLNEADRELIRRNSGGSIRIKDDEKRQAVVDIGMELEENVQENGKAEISGYLPLLGGNNAPNSYIPAAGDATIDRLISLKDLFPAEEDKNQLKRIRNRREKERRRKRKREQKQLGEGESSLRKEDEQMVPESSNSTQTGEGNPVENAINNRKLIGRVVRGDYSFVKAHGMAFGYVPFPLLKLVGKDGRVLIRNTTSKFGHPARLSIYSGQLSI